MKKQLLTITTLAIIGLSNLANAQAPNWQWAKSAGGANDDKGYSVATDANGNVFMAGYFESPTITFGTTTLTNAVSIAIFIVKYNASGNVIWAKSATGYSCKGLSVTTDAIGNVFVTGNFSNNNITFGTTTLTNAGGADIFIVKYDASGNLLWAKSAGGIGNDEGYSVSTNANGNVFLTGGFTSPTITFGTTTLINSSFDTTDIFIVKYDVSGNVLWAKSGGGGDYDYGQSIATDASGSVFITGVFRSPTITFGSTILTNAGSNGWDIFIAKYDASGNLLWAKSEGGTSHDVGYSVATDVSGNVFMTGGFSSPSVTFGTTTLSNASANYDIFIVKYDSSGNVLWAKREGGTYHDESYSVATDVNGNVFMTGYFSSTSITIGTTTLTNAGNEDIFIAKYDSSGNALWAKSEGGSYGDVSQSVVTDAIGNVFITGYFRSNPIFFGTTMLFSAGSYDVFLAKLNSTTGIEEQQNAAAYSIAPNPFSSQTNINFKEEQKNTTIKIIDVLGKEIKVINFSGKQLILEKGEMQAGIYFVQAINEKQIVMNRKIVID